MSLNYAWRTTGRLVTIAHPRDISIIEIERTGCFLLQADVGRILTAMRRWLYLVTVPLGLVMLAYLIAKLNFPIHFAEIWSGNNQAKNPQADVGKIPDVKPVRIEVLELRQVHQLRPLNELEDGRTIQNLPKGVYGFSACSELLDAKRGNKFSLEIHKRRDGIVYYVGYASDADVGKYLARQKNFHILTFPYPHERASSLFEIPIDFVSKCEVRPLRNGHLFDLFVTAIPELQS